MCVPKLLLLLLLLVSGLQELRGIGNRRGGECVQGGVGLGLARVL